MPRVEFNERPVQVDGVEKMIVPTSCRLAAMKSTSSSQFQKMTLTIFKLNSRQVQPKMLFAKLNHVMKS